MSHTQLPELAASLLAEAHAAAGGRAAHTLLKGHEHRLRQALLALTANHRLGEHSSPGEATLQVLVGRVTLHSATLTWTGSAGDHLVLPAERHDLAALEDSVVLLTTLTGVS